MLSSSDLDPSERRYPQWDGERPNVRSPKGRDDKREIAS